MTVDEASGDPVELWPDNLESANVFIAMSSQWRTGAVGATGLDYAALPAVLRLLAIPRASQAQVFDDVRYMEGEALATMRSQRS
jgi:hypothetical protein